MAGEEEAWTYSRWLQMPLWGPSRQGMMMVKERKKKVNHTKVQLVLG